MASSFNVTGVWSMVGVSFALVALYLVLTNFAGAKGVLSALFSGYTSVLSTLQGRS